MASVDARGVVAVGALILLVSVYAVVTYTPVQKIPIFVPGNPSISEGVVYVSYPAEYAELAQYVLGLINQDRLSMGLQGVNLSTVPSGQQHADSMLYFGYFSHEDPQGYKPYMRYTLLNGTGAVDENIAYQGTIQPGFTTMESVMAALNRLNFEMMYDDGFSDWGHRTNILDPSHTRVSIGIAYNATIIFLVEDFESGFIDYTQPLSYSGGVVSLQGTLEGDSLVSASVYYDPPVEPIGVVLLQSSPIYSEAYTAGSLVGIINPACSTSCATYEGALQLGPTSWSGGPGAVSASFDIEPLVEAHGAGVYTLYFVDPAGAYITSFSIFVA